MIVKSRYRVLPLLAMAYMLAPTVAGAAEPQIGTGETDGYRLVWQDLFDAGELNPLRWDIEVTGAGGGNNELQYYTDNETNVRVGDDGEGNGCLILTAIREEYKGKHFTSGRINSKNRVAFTHGKIEASVRIPRTADGLWPAFWMMGNDYDAVGWPKCGETDILEMGNTGGINAGTQERFFNGACHWGEKWPDNCYARDNTKSYSLQDGEFHLFTVIWDEDVIEMYLDLDKYPVQVPYYKMNIKADAPDDVNSPGNYFHKDNFILFNLAVGGNFTGIHDHEKITALNDDNNHQASLYVNYVKVYQKGADNENLVTLVDGDPVTNGIQANFNDSVAVAPRFDGVNVTAGADSVLEIYDIQGALLRSGRCSLAVNDLPSGLYIVKATGAGSSVSTLKLAL